MKPRTHIAPNTRFGMLVTTGDFVHGKKGFEWECRCDCGTLKTIIRNYLIRGRIVSCGCKRLAMLRSSSFEHGLTGTREHNIWKEIFRRCYDRKRPAYKNYGGRGISMCERWRTSFINFIADMGECPKGYSIERENNNGNYEPNNCIWASKITQANNNRANVIVEFRGVKMTLANACREAGISYTRARDRIAILGWPIEKALLEPKHVN